MSLITFQDFEKASNKPEFIGKAISDHLSSDVYKIAKEADLYDRQLNVTIHNYIKIIFSLTGSPVEDFTASNNKLASNFFHRLNTQRCVYLLGNGVSFTEHKEDVVDESGVKVTTDLTKEKLGNKFDADLKHIAYFSLIHGISFGFWNVDKMHVFPVTEFVPIWDEETGALRAGIRFWRLDEDKPLMVVLYEEDGYTKYKQNVGASRGDFEEVQPKRTYKTIIMHTEADGDAVIGEENYSSLPIVPLWGSKLHQSTLVGMKEKIDSFDLIRSGFANDLTDCSEIYWILENCSGMSDADLAKFRDRLKINHIATVDVEGGSAATPYTQEVPFQARQAYLDSIRAGIYEDFGALDVHTVAAGATNDHIDAAYQPLDEESDDFEYQICEFLQRILALVGIEDTPVFKRNRISNQTEQTQMILSAAEYLDDETVLQKLPFISVDEISGILAKKDMANMGRIQFNEGPSEAQEDTSDTEEAQPPV